MGANLVGQLRGLEYATRANTRQEGAIMAEQEHRWGWCNVHGGAYEIANGICEDCQSEQEELEPGDPRIPEESDGDSR